MPERPGGPRGGVGVVRVPEVLVAVAHGSADPRAAATLTALMAVVAERAAARDRARGRDVGLPAARLAYLGHAAPSLPQVIGTIGSGQQPGRVTVLPLLLTAAYHSKTDIPRVLARLSGEFPRLEVSYGATLGPHPLLLRALERRLAEADPLGPARHADPAYRGRTAVVLAAAGSTDPEANAAVARLAAHWQARAGWFAVCPAHASAALNPAAPGTAGKPSAAPAPGAAVTALLRAGAGRVLVATYLLAPGFFADRVGESALAAGAAAVSPPLGASPEVAEVLLDRYQEARSRRRAAA
jgi:sirohydrochlorin ferrochelatase